MVTAETVRIRTDLRAGDAGEIVRLHGVHYAAEYGLDRTFEAHLARGLADALERGWPGPGEGVWIAEHGGGHIGGVLALTREDATLGRVRWFLLDPALRGRGVGRRLLQALLETAGKAGYERLELATFSALKAAAHLYVDAGFRCVESRRTQLWGRTIVLQRYELAMRDAA
jgi:GNAT superfamily N-acetyltransferase